MKYLYYDKYAGRVLKNGKKQGIYRKTKSEYIARSHATKSDDDGNYYYWKILPLIGFPAGNAVPVRVNVIEAEYVLK